MARSRIAEALASGAVTLPAEGRIAIFGAPATADLSALPGDRLVIAQGVRADHDAWADRGLAVAPEPPQAAAAAVVFLPRAKDLARARVAAALAILPAGAPVVVDGQRTDGIDGFLRLCRGAFSVGTPVSMGHGKLFAFPATAAPKGWAAQPRELPGGFVTAPGAFSADAIDPGSAALAAALPARMTGRIADLGAGWGYLAAEVLKRPEVDEVHLFEADHAALAAARANLGDPRARFHWADVPSLAGENDFDAVVANPPFHAGRAAEPVLGQAFIASAARLLRPGGTLWLVANRHLPYEKSLSEHFAKVEPLDGSPAFKLFRATRLRRR